VAGPGSEVVPVRLRESPPAVRLTLLAVLCWVRRAELPDELAELLIDLVHRIGARAETRVERDRPVLGLLSVQAQHALALGLSSGSGLDFHERVRCWESPPRLIGFVAGSPR